jgi:hypothetical protein
MKKYLILAFALVFAQAAFCKSTPINREHENVAQPASDSLKVYTGKYQMARNGQTFYLQIELTDGELILHALWDDNKNALKQVTGGNFIVAGAGWAVKFQRDKDGKVNSLVAQGSDHWTRVKE